ncbi:MAG: response regulator [Bacteroidetes bacterium]|nr:response regulator [Bacteroidota bacterium]
MNRKILIVEDEFIVADDLQLTLIHAGYDVLDIATSVKEAMIMIAEEAPGLVLLDIQLKGAQNGISLAKTLREKGIPFIYLSANSNNKIIEAVNETKPNGFLVKPFREKDLFNAVDKVFQLKPEQ